METVPPMPVTNPPPATSVWLRLLNVFAAPGEVFAEIKDAAPATANWLAPVGLLILAAFISTGVIFSQPGVTQQIREQQRAAFDKQVSAGKMTQAQADEAAAMAEKFSGPVLLAVFGCVGAVITGFATPFWSALWLWLIARFYLKSPVGYLKVLEVAGLSLMIIALAVVVKTALVVLTGNFSAALNPLLLMKSADPHRPLHQILMLLDVMTFWLLAVRAIGLAKLTGATFGKTAAAVFAVWLVMSGLVIGGSLATQAIFAK